MSLASAAPVTGARHRQLLQQLCAPIMSVHAPPRLVATWGNVGVDVNGPTPTESRQGRHKQRYGEGGERLVAGCVLGWHELCELWTCCALHRPWRGLC